MSYIVQLQMGLSALYHHVIRAIQPPSYEHYFDHELLIHGLRPKPSLTPSCPSPAKYKLASILVLEILIQTNNLYFLILRAISRKQYVMATSERPRQENTFADSLTLQTHIIHLKVDQR